MGFKLVLRSRAWAVIWGFRDWGLLGGKGLLLLFFFFFWGGGGGRGRAWAVSYGCSFWGWDVPPLYKQSLTWNIIPPIITPMK